MIASEGELRVERIAESSKGEVVVASLLFALLATFDSEQSCSSHEPWSARVAEDRKEFELTGSTALIWPVGLFLVSSDSFTYLSNPLAAEACYSVKYRVMRASKNWIKKLGVVGATRLDLHGRKGFSSR
jgi:hypothetical protein